MPLRAGVYVSGALVRGGRLLLLRRAPGDTTRAGLWELPGGSVEQGETLQEAVEREVWEETGMRVSVDAPYAADLFEARRSDGSRGPVVAIRFRCRGPYEGEPRLARGEHDAFAWVAPGELEAHATHSGGLAVLRLAFGSE